VDGEADGGIIIFILNRFAKAGMIKKVLLLVFLSAGLCPGNLFAQALNWQWADGSGGTNIDWGRSIATDENGNVFVTGSFRSFSLSCGSFTLNNADNYGYQDFILAKYDASGNVLWAKRAGDSLKTEVGEGICVDRDGNVLVTGYFDGASVAFDSDTLYNETGLAMDIFVVKYDTGGNVIWAKRIGGSYDDTGTEITVDASNNILVAGHFRSLAITFDTITLFNAGSSNYYDMFVTKLDPSGNVMWAKSQGGTDTDFAYGIVTDASNNVFVTGYFKSTTIAFGADVFHNAGIYDIYLVKYDSSGTIVWARSAGGVQSDVAYAIDIDKNGNVIIAGDYSSSSLVFGSVVLNNAYSGIPDAYVTKYDSGGNVLWAKAKGGSGTEQAYGLVVDTADNIFITGNFGSPTIAFGSSTLTNAGGADMYLLKYDSSGNELWGKSAGNINNDIGFSIAADRSNNIFVTGYFGNPSITFGSSILTNAGSSDLYVAKLGGTSTDVNENIFSDKMILYPNPAHNVVNVKCKMENAELKIYDVMGRVVYEQSIINQKSEIINSFSPGMYFVRVESGKKVWTEKLVVE
jgi:hypothetical protein